MSDGDRTEESGETYLCVVPEYEEELVSKLPECHGGEVEMHKAAFEVIHLRFVAVNLG